MKMMDYDRSNPLLSRLLGMINFQKEVERSSWLIQNIVRELALGRLQVRVRELF